MRTIKISQPYIYTPSKQKRHGLVEVTDRRTYNTGIYTVNRKDKQETLQDVLLTNIEESFAKEGLPEKIRAFSEKMKYKDIVEHVSKVRFFATTQEYEMPFLREGLFDYYFYKKGDYIRSLMARPRGRTLNPHMYESLPLMPMGLSSRYFLQDRMNHIHSGEVKRYELEYAEDRGYFETPIDIFSSLWDESKNKVFDFVLHPMFFSVDRNTQKRLIQNTVKGIAIWSNFLNEIIVGRERRALVRHANMVMSQRGEATDEASAEYYRMLGQLRTLHTRKDFYFRLCGVDDFLFFRRINDIVTLSNRRPVKDINITYPLHDINHSRLYGYEGWNIGTTMYLTNYMYHLLYFILYTIHKEDPAFQLMERWFMELRENVSEATTRPFRQDNVKRYYRSYRTYGQVSGSSRYGTAPDTYGYNTYIYFIADEGIWQDKYVQSERTASSYGQFLIPIDLMNLEEAFDAPTPLKLFQWFIDEADRATSVTMEDLHKKWERLAKLREILAKESDEAYEQTRQALPASYLG